jgi:3-oxoacyl-[acyl-carrier protein] reductase
MDGGKSGQEVPRAMSNMGAYTISKFGLLGVLAQLNGEYPWLRISAVKPGFTDTSMLRIFDDRFLNQMREQKEFSTPEEVAAEIVERLALNDTGL